jgi:hypothetical protein
MPIDCFCGSGRVLPRAGLPAAVPSSRASRSTPTPGFTRMTSSASSVRNYGAREPLSLERLSALPDGRLAYRMKRASPTGETHLVLPPVAFLRRVAALVPPRRARLVRYFGVFAPNARVRSPAPSPPLLTRHRGPGSPERAGAGPAPALERPW